MSDELRLKGILKWMTYKYSESNPMVLDYNEKYNHYFYESLSSKRSRYKIFHNTDRKNKGTDYER